MTQHDILGYAKLRFAVGCLGEAATPPWWNAGLFSAESDAFLTPIFPRSQYLARMTATCEAAARIHDEHIGVGQVFHLFRLPEAFEQQIAEVASTSDFREQVSATVGGINAARSLIDQLARGAESVEGSGPVNVGMPDDLSQSETLAAIADAYRQGFEKESRIYPFVSGREG